MRSPPAWRERTFFGAACSRANPNVSCYPAALSRTATGLRGELFHLGVQVRLAFEADARQVRHRDVAVVHLHAVRETAVGLEQVRIGFVAAETQARCNVQRHLVATMRDAAARRPAGLAPHVER